MVRRKVFSTIALVAFCATTTSCGPKVSQIVPHQPTALHAVRRIAAIPPGGFNPDCTYTYTNVSGSYDPAVDPLESVDCPASGGGGSTGNPDGSPPVDPGYQNADDASPYAPAIVFAGPNPIKLLDAFAKLLKAFKPGRTMFGKRLNKHFRDHGKDFNARNPADYAQKSQDFLNNSIQSPNSVIIKWNPSEQTIRIYDPVTNTFGSFTESGTTRTFFKPAEGQTYFEQQTGITLPRTPQGIALTSCAGQCSPATDLPIASPPPALDPSVYTEACGYDALRHGYYPPTPTILDTTTTIDVAENNADVGPQYALPGVRYYRLLGDLGTCVWGLIVMYNGNGDAGHSVDGNVYIWSE